jgi:hypothetical protein
MCAELGAARQATLARMVPIGENWEGAPLAGPAPSVRPMSAFERRFSQLRPVEAAGFRPEGTGAARVTLEDIAVELDAHERDPFPSVQTGAPPAVAAALFAVADGDLLAYIRAIKSYRQLIARLLLVVGAQPVCTALLEGSFSVAGWLDDPRRSCLRAELLRAQTILACNRELATDAAREIARTFLKGKWVAPEIETFQPLEFED